MTVLPLTERDGLWEAVADYALECSWRAGKSLARQMKDRVFSGWERVFAALDGEEIAGFCTLAKTDCLPDIPYTPYIGFVFVGEPYRGNRLSQKLIETALQYAKTVQFERVYLVSDHRGLYEKYGFAKVDERPAPWDSGVMESVYMHLT